MMPGADGLAAHWMAETVRLREAHWGPLEDASESRRARAEGRGLAAKILLRARYLGQREKLDELLARWKRGARLALLGLAVAALFAGAGAALGALGNGERPVNLLLALFAILGLHTLTFLAWLLSFGVHAQVAGLGRLWLWLTRKLARSPDAALAPRALLELLSRNGALRWILGGVSHGLWVCAFASLLLVLVAVLSTRRYTFGWETTLLSADAFVHATTILGWLPARLGFAMPAADMVRASNGLHTLPASVQMLWSSWLLGCVLAYGLLPRLLALLLCLYMSRRRLAATALDASLPGYAELRERLQPSSEQTGIDAPDTGEVATRIPSGHGAAQAGRPLVVGIELPGDEPWPVQALPEGMADGGNIDSRTQRNALLESLRAHPPSRLLAVCDARQTPDRGALALLAELAAPAGELRILLHGAAAGAGRSAAWRERLAAAGRPADSLYEHWPPALAWLQHGGDPSQADSGAGPDAPAPGRPQPPLQEHRDGRN
ncbi:DUF2868 domain-containing protein [Candidimonas nitroreducens]